MPSDLIRSTAKKMGLRELYEFVGNFASPFRGVYDTWEEAREAIPESRKVGYNHPEMASKDMHYAHQMRLSDYAAMFWMKSAISKGSSVFDLGGNIGLACYAFEKYLNYPSELRWIVCDVPEVIRLGRELARQRHMTRLDFTDNYRAADGADILLTAGTLQCIRTPLSEILGYLQAKPKHLLINRTPLYGGKSFFTIRGLPPVTLVYCVFNRKEFIDSVLAHGYQLIDSWDISEPACGLCVIPFHPERSIRSYSGLYFRLNGCKVD